MTPASDGITPAVPCKTIQSCQQSLSLYVACASAQRMPASHWVTLGDNLLLSNGTCSSAASTGLGQAGARGDREQDEGIISVPSIPPLHSAVRQGTCPFPTALGTRHAFVLSPVCQSCSKPYSAPPPKDAPVLVVADGARGVVGLQ